MTKTLTTLLRTSTSLAAAGAFCVGFTTELLAGVITGPVTNPSNNHRYYLLTNANWSDSQAEAVTLGGHLVTINDPIENQWVFDTFSNFGGVRRNLWTGLTDDVAEGSFLWISGDPSTYRNWSAGEPNTFMGNNEDYAHIWASGYGSATAAWNDVPGTNTTVDPPGFSGTGVYGVVEVVPSPPSLVGPVPYLSFADVPADFYADPANVTVENFEDGTLDFGITANGGGLAAPGAMTDSVDADDGVIDGSGTSGRSWFVSDQGDRASMTFTFAEPLPKSAGIVWTDGEASHDIYFEAFGPGMNSLGILGPFNFADTVNSGTTGEDRFFGVKNVDGILALKVTNLESVPLLGGLEIDHIQFENTAEPKLTVSGTNGGIQLSWVGLAGYLYQIEYDDDLIGPWAIHGSVLAGDGINFNIPVEPLPVPKRFYRLRYWPSP
jgi:hypothetical protein